MCYMMDYSRASDVPCGGLKCMYEMGGKMLCAAVNPYLSRNDRDYTVQVNCWIL